MTATFKNNNTIRRLERPESSYLVGEMYQPSVEDNMASPKEISENSFQPNYEKSTCKTLE